MNFSAALNRSIIHKRCGHRGWQLLKFMNSCDCYKENGFRIDESEFNGEKCLCEACTLAKMNKRQNRNTVDRFRYSPGELWYADVSGPFVPSLIFKNIYKVVSGELFLMQSPMIQSLIPAQVNASSTFGTKGLYSISRP